MGYLYALIVVDDEGNSIVDLQLTPDQAVAIIAPHLHVTDAVRPAPVEKVRPAKKVAKKKKAKPADVRGGGRRSKKEGAEGL